MPVIYDNSKLPRCKKCGKRYLHYDKYLGECRSTDDLCASCHFHESIRKHCEEYRTNIEKILKEDDHERLS